MIPVQIPNTIWALELQGTLLTPLMARNSLKSNVTWTSYPFVPPTGTSGFFADLLGGMKWHETNDNQVRHLHKLPGCEGVYALGAYPAYGRMSRRHFRAHIGSLAFNYEAYVWSAGQNEGKKLAVIEEFLTDTLRFVVIGFDPEPLHQLNNEVRGRIAPIAKKCSVQLEFKAVSSLTRFERQLATGTEKTLAVMPFGEIGNLPEGLAPYLVPLASEGTRQGIMWHTQYCAWHPDLRFREGISIYKADSKGISCSLLESIGTTDIA